MRPVQQILQPSSKFDSTLSNTQRGKTFPLQHLQSQVFPEQLCDNTHENTQWGQTLQVGRAARHTLVIHDSDNRI